jgi:formate-dependent nitrite reductase membrane component NrfD
MIAALYVALGHASVRGAVGIMPAVLATAGTAFTAALLVADLKQPRRFLYILTRPNWSSWLVRGAVVLGVYALVGAAWFVSAAAGSERALQLLAVPAALGAAGAAAYTAALFAQCEGRDLWQTPLLLPDLLAQAVIAGAAAFGLADLVLDTPAPDVVRWALLGSLAAHLALVTGEVVPRHTRHVAVAIRVLVSGREAGRFWAGIVAAVIAIGLDALALAGLSSVTLTALASVVALVALVLYEAAFVRAGQAVPLS